ncbi:MAG TPA: DHHA1 domain-containing protein, partial [Lachnospiraceae bacterium]|nr:DHHA1 domain-containing protein [Lachnospiraceae bacterium]
VTGSGQEQKYGNPHDYQADKVLVLYLPDCHESLAGIVAGRVKERYYKPVIVLTKGEDGIKGSGRSIEAYSMYEELMKCRDLFTKFGGHKMAAGLSMHESAISELRERLNENAVLSEEDLTEKVTIDIPMPVMYATETFIEELNLLAPFGIGNPRPLFAQKDLKIRSLQVLGKNRNVVRLKLETLQEAGRAPVITDAICFGEGDTIEAELSKKESVSIVYYPEFNEYLGRRNMQIVIRDYQ